MTDVNQCISIDEAMFIIHNTTMPAQSIGLKYGKKLHKGGANNRLEGIRAGEFRR